MANMFPKIEEVEFKCNAEREFYNVLEVGLDNKWSVFYSVGWIPTVEEKKPSQSEGEVDFILLHREYGVMVIEVKGGIISCENSVWKSKSSGGEIFTIKDPVKQVNTSKNRVIEEFKKNKIATYTVSAVCFPDCTFDNTQLPLNLSEEIIIDIKSITNIEKKILSIFDFCRKNTAFRFNGISESNFSKINSILNPRINSRVPLKFSIEKIKMRQLKLTSEQLEAIESIEGNKFVAINGYAGTGKTVIAINIAIEESKKGKKGMYICYNDLLAESIKAESNNEFEVYPIYEFAKKYITLLNNSEYCSLESIKEKSESKYYDLIMEYFLAELQNDRKLEYDFILIDEGQDFYPEWFEAIKGLLNEDGIIRVFYDEKQMLYTEYGRKSIEFLKSVSQYNLKKIIRNTDPICKVFTKVIECNEKNLRLPGLLGDNPEFVYYKEDDLRNNKLGSKLNKLVVEEGIKHSDIAVITMKRKNKEIYKKSLNRDFEGVIETIRRFKGLEKDFIIIPDIKWSNFKEDEYKNLLYVGMSRAKCHLIVMIDTTGLTRKDESQFKKDMKEKYIS